MGVPADTSEDRTTDELIAQLQRGDRRAASELVRRYEPEVRRFVRFRIFSSQLRRIVDSFDVSQSVLARFFVQWEAGEIVIQSHEQLRNLLLLMARNQLYDVARRQQAQKRDVRRVVSHEFETIADDDDTPSEQIANAELLDAVQARLSPRERQLVQSRLAGRSWEELAVQWQSTAEAVRKQLCRAIDRVARELGVIE